MDAAEVAIIRDQLARIKKSGQVSGTTRVKDLLEYVVEETLAGRPHTLKEYEIGRAVFGKREDFDPKQDRIVSTTAGNLRKKIAEYYLHDGIADGCVIDIPKGRFVPTFAFRARGSAEKTSEVPDTAHADSAIRAETENQAPRPSRKKKWVTAALIGVGVLAAILAIILFQSAHAGFHITVQGGSKTVGPTADITVDGWRAGLNYYLMVEPKLTSSYSRQRWLQFKVNGPHETRTAQFGQGDTTSGTSYRIYVLSTNSELREGKELDHGKLVLAPDDEMESPAVTVVLQK